MCTKFWAKLEKRVSETCYMTDDVFRRTAMSGTQDLNDATALKMGVYP
jgi:hypothetical protein